MSYIQDSNSPLTKKSYLFGKKNESKSRIVNLLRCIVTFAIVNTASIDGAVGDPLYFAYCASKSAVQAMTRCAALYCGEQKLAIRVNAVAPGYILTPMAVQDAEERGMSLDEYEEAMSVDHPIGHIGRPEDIANAYLYLASDEAAFVTGTTLMVDGGYTAR